MTYNPISVEPKFSFDDDFFSQYYVPLISRHGATVYLPRETHEFLGGPEFTVGAKRQWTFLSWSGHDLAYGKRAVRASLDAHGSRARFSITPRKVGRLTGVLIERLPGERPLPGALQRERAAVMALFRSVETEEDLMQAFAAKDALEAKLVPGVPLHYGAHGGDNDVRALRAAKRAAPPHA